MIFAVMVTGALKQKLDNLPFISVPKRQNPVPLHLVKLTYGALKFLVHFSLLLPTKVPQRHSKVVTHKE